MKKYQATIRIKGQRVSTVVFADSPLHARLIIEYHYGINTIEVGPSLTKESKDDDDLVDNMIRPIKPLTPAEARIKGLKQGLDRSRKALKAEQERQRQQRENERKLKQQAQTTLS